jgi:hypothetical protein
LQRQQGQIIAPLEDAGFRQVSAQMRLIGVFTRGINDNGKTVAAV